MKSFACILAAAVLSGLATFYLYDGLGTIGLLGSNVVINIAVFISLLAFSTMGSAALALAMRGAIAKSDDRLVARLEARIRALENSPSSSRPTPPPAPLPGPAARPSDLSATRS